MKKQILDEDWWEDLVLMDKLFKPIVDLLRLVDSDLPTMGKASCSCRIPCHILKILPDLLHLLTCETDCSLALSTCLLIASLLAAGLLLLLLDG